MRPQTDDYPQELEQVVLALLSEGREAAAQLLAPIAYDRDSEVLVAPASRLGIFI